MSTASFDALRQFDKAYASSTHCSSDLIETLVSEITYSRGFYCDRSNFGPRPHQFLYQQARPRLITHKTPFSLADKALEQIAHCNKDVQDHLIATLFSNVTLQSPIKYHQKEPHDYLRFLKVPTKQQRPSSVTKNSAPLRTMKDGQILSFLQQKKILFPAAKTPTFSVLFPSTAVPTITFVLGTPKIDRSVYSILLTSVIRSSKSEISQAGFIPPKSFSTLVIRSLSRMIHRSLTLHMTEIQAKLQKKKTPPTPKDTVPKVKASKEKKKKTVQEPKVPTTPRTTQFVQSSVPEKTLLPDILLPEPSFLTGPSLMEIDNRKRLLTLVRRFAAMLQKTPAESELRLRSMLRLIQKAPGSSDLCVIPPSHFSGSHIPITCIDLQCCDLSLMNFDTDWLSTYDDLSIEPFEDPIPTGYREFDWIPPPPTVIERQIPGPETSVCCCTAYVCSSGCDKPYCDCPCDVCNCVRSFHFD